MKVSPSHLAALLLTTGITSLITAEAGASAWQCDARAGARGWSCVAAPDGGATTEDDLVETASLDNSPESLLPEVSEEEVYEESAMLVGSDGSRAAVRDWVDLEKLTPEQRAKLGPGCCGKYVSPLQPISGDKKALNESPTHVSANKSSMLQDGTGVMSGDVDLRQGNRQIRADTISLNKQAQTVHMEGNLEFREPNVLLLSEVADANLADGTFSTSDASYLLHDMHVHGDATEIERDANGAFHLQNTTYSYCAPGDNGWQLEAAQLELDPNTGQGKGRNVWVTAGGVPIFYTPYIQFPLGSARQSGLLPPSFSFTGDGPDLLLPVYLNLAPNYDATILTRIIGKRGVQLGGEFRHLSEWFETKISGTYLDDNDAERERWLFAVDQTGGRQQPWRTIIDYTSVSDDDYFSDLGTRGLHVNTISHLNQMLDTRYLTDHWRFGATLQEFQTIDPNATVDSVDPFNAAPTAGNNIEPYSMLPRLVADGDYFYDRAGIVFNSYNELTSFRHSAGSVTGWLPYVVDAVPGPGTLYNIDIPDADRLYLDYRAARPFTSQAGHITPAVALRYMSKNVSAGSNTGFGYGNESITVPVFSVDSGLVFQREINFSDKTFLQTLEPKAFYHFADYQQQNDEYYSVNTVTGLPANLNGGSNQFTNFDTGTLSFNYDQLYRDNRFAGHDRIADANQIALGLETHIASTTTGKEVFSAGIGQIFYFEDRRVTLLPQWMMSTREKKALTSSTSPVAAKAKLQLSDAWSANADTTWGGSNGEQHSSGFEFKYADNERRIFSAGIRNDTNVVTGRQLISAVVPVVTPIVDVQQTDITQVYTSAVLPVSAQWSIIGSEHYDIDNAQNLETLAGFQYDDCCWGVRVVLKSWNDYDYESFNNESSSTKNGIFFEVVLKGLGSFGDQIDGMLSRSIDGYEDGQHDW